jgi:Ca2+-binding EF-hand superfamily protein
LDSQEVTNLINDALKQMQQSRKVTPEEVNQFINSVDTNNDKKINRDELLQIFKKVVTQTK